jgi:hypothetical protein
MQKLAIHALPGSVYTLCLTSKIVGSMESPGRTGQTAITNDMSLAFTNRGRVWFSVDVKREVFIGSAPARKGQ